MKKKKLGEKIGEKKIKKKLIEKENYKIDGKKFQENFYKLIYE